ncbi:MAG TPA: hypothetical protein VEC99_18325 [Clostridia bacterium]|nr:hypothetical protein [Clostridia bacterium]
MPQPCTVESVLVYDLRQDAFYREQILSGLEAQWQAYERGEVPVQISQGRITRLFMDTFDCKPTFELEESDRRSFWVRRGNASAYAIGKWAWVESVVFHAPAPIGDLSVVTRIWVEDGASKRKTAQLPLVSPLGLDRSASQRLSLRAEDAYCRTGRIAGMCRELRLQKRPTPKFKQAARPASRQKVPWTKRLLQNLWGDRGI